MIKDDSGSFWHPECFAVDPDRRGITGLRDADEDGSECLCCGKPCDELPSLSWAVIQPGNKTSGA